MLFGCRIAEIFAGLVRKGPEPFDHIGVLGGDVNQRFALLLVLELVDPMQGGLRRARAHKSPSGEAG